MEILNYEILIHASPEKVWQILWDPDTYTEWTQYFAPGSSMHSDWQVNGRTVFLDANGDGGFNHYRAGRIQTGDL